MFSTQSYGSRLPQLLTFCSGLVVIVAASVLNVLYDLDAASGEPSFPAFMQTIYDLVGKRGVTLFLTTVGSAIMLLGMAVPQTRWKRSSRPKSEYLSRFPSLALPKESPNSPRSGGVALQTRKYLSE